MLLKYFCVFLIVLQSGTIIDISCHEPPMTTTEPSPDGTTWPSTTEGNGENSTEPTIDYSSKFTSTVGHSTAKDSVQTTSTKSDNSRKGEAQSTKDKDDKNQGMQIKGNILASIVISTAVLYISIMN